MNLEIVPVPLVKNDQRNHGKTVSTAEIENIRPIFL